MPLTLEQIRLLTPGQKLTMRCKTINGWNSARRTAYKGRKEILDAGRFDCDVLQDRLAQTVTIGVEEKKTQ